MTSVLLLGGIAGVAYAQSAFPGTSQALIGAPLACCCCCPIVIVVFVVIIILGLIAGLFFPDYHRTVVTVNSTGKSQDSFVQPDKTTAYCKSCGAPVDDSYDYCHKCGAKLEH